MESIAFSTEYMKSWTGNAAAALLLSQIVYWYLPGKTGKPKLRIKKNEIFWIAKSNIEWFDEIGLSPSQCRTSLKRLKSKGLIEVEVHRFNGAPTQHVRLRCAQGKPALSESPSSTVLLCEVPFAPHGKSICPLGPNDLPPATNPFVDGDKSVTESTAESTAETILGAASPCPMPEEYPEYTGEGTGEMDVQNTLKQFEAEKKQGYLVQKDPVFCMSRLWVICMGSTSTL